MVDLIEDVLLLKKKSTKNPSDPNCYQYYYFDVDKMRSILLKI